MALLLSIIGLLAFLALWTLAWRNRPILAFGIFLGTASVCVLGILIRPPDIQHIPLWLPPLPFAVVAITLLYFGVLAWWWGRRS
jgi:hypothetical protein